MKEEQDKPDFKKWLENNDLMLYIGLTDGGRGNIINLFAEDYAKHENKEKTVNFLIHMLMKYEGCEIIERWQMEEEYDEWYNQKFKDDGKD